MEHLYGPNDNHSKFVSWLFHSLRSNVAELNLTSGIQKRDFIHVFDAISAINHLLVSLDHLPLGFSEIGLGTGNMTSIREFVECAHRVYESTTSLHFGAIP